MEIHKIVTGNYQNEDAVEILYRYISREEQIKRRGGTGIYPIEKESICRQIEIVQKNVEQELERNLFHYIVSLESWVNIEFIEKRARLISKRIGERYQNYWAIHRDTENPHIHFMINPVSYCDGNILTAEELKRMVRAIKDYKMEWRD